MGIFFSKSKQKSRVTDEDKAILQLKQTRDEVKRYQRKLEQSLEKERLLAKQLIHKGQKDRALLLLRKKRFQEQILSKTDGQLENLERMVHDIEFTQVETRVLDGLKTGNVALKKVQELLSIEDIEKVMDDTREGVEKQKELDEILLGVLTQEEEDEVEAELDSLLEQEIKEAAPQVPDIMLPDVPEDLPEKEKAERAKPSAREAVALEA